MRNDILDDGISLFGCLIWVFIAVCWIANLVGLFNCDFEAPFKEEVIHLIGVFIPPASIVTCWY